MTFQCNTSHLYGCKIWTGSINVIRQSPSFCEAVVHARGTLFHLIAGSYQGGNYLCIPDLNIGCGLAKFKDTFWNREQISRYLNAVDTESLVSAISCLPEPEKEPWI